MFTVSSFVWLQALYAECSHPLRLCKSALRSGRPSPVSFPFFPPPSRLIFFIFSRFVSECISPHFLSSARPTLSTSLLFFSPPVVHDESAPRVSGVHLLPVRHGCTVHYVAMVTGFFFFFKSRKSMLTSEIWIWWERTLTEVTQRLFCNVSDHGSARLGSAAGETGPPSPTFFLFYPQGIALFWPPQQKEIKMSVRPSHCTLRWKKTRVRQYYFLGLFSLKCFAGCQHRHRVDSTIGVY